MLAGSSSSPLVLAARATGGKVTLVDHWALLVEPGGRLVGQRPSAADSFALSKQYKAIGDELISALEAESHRFAGVRWPRVSVELAFGPFIRAYVEFLRVRTVLFENALSEVERPELLSAVPLADWRTPQSSKDFIRMARTSVAFNRQLFTMVAESRGVGTSARGIQPLEEDRPARQADESPSRKWQNVSLPSCKEQGLCAHVHCAPNFFARRYGIALWITTAGTIVAEPPVDPPRSVRGLDKGIRSRVFGGSSANGIVGELWAGMEHLLPTTLLEDLPNAIEHARAKPSPRAVVGPVPSRDEDHVRLAVHAARGSSIYFAQHGGYYGETVPKHSEVHERSASTRFLTWGWIDGEECHSLPSPRLTHRMSRSRLSRLRGRLRQISWKDRQGVTLWVTQDPWPWDNRLPPVASGVELYVQSCRRFLEALDAESAARILLRYRPNKYGLQDLEVRQPQRTVLSSLPTAPDGASIHALIDGAALVVLDKAFTTTFLECISRDVPVIVFDEVAFSYVRFGVRELYEDLAKVEIVHPNPEEAARIVNSIGDDIRAWWNEPERQRVVQRVAKALARTGPSLLTEWRAFLLEALNTPSRNRARDTADVEHVQSLEIERGES